MTYVPPEYITAQEVKDRMGPAKVTQVFDDTGSGTASADPLAFAILEASAHVGSLWASFGVAVITELAEDYVVKGILCELVMAIGSKRRAEFDDSKFDEKIAALLKQIGTIGDARKRLHSETTAGTNARVKSRGNFTPPRVHLFAGSRTNPCGGGGI